MPHLFELLQNRKIDVVDDNLKLPKIQSLVYKVIIDNPGLRKPEISSKCDISISSVNNAIASLREKGLITYIGSTKTGGYYIV